MLYVLLLQWIIWKLPVSLYLRSNLYSVKENAIQTGSSMCLCDVYLTVPPLRPPSGNSSDSQTKVHIHIWISILFGPHTVVYTCILYIFIEEPNLHIDGVWIVVLTMEAKRDYGFSWRTHRHLIGWRRQAAGQSQCAFRKLPLLATRGDPFLFLKRNLTITCW